MNVRFEINPERLPSSDAILELYKIAGIYFPNWSIERMERALENSSFVVCAWHEEDLIGFARGISDFAWSGWLSQIAIAPKFQKKGVGRKIMDLILERLGDEASLLTHSAEASNGFYESLGFELYSNVYRLKRKK